MTHTTWSYPNSIRTGAGRVAEIGSACREAGIANPLIVTDPGMIDLPPISAVQAALATASLPDEVFCDLRPNPVGSDVANGVAAFTAGAHDGVIAVGGGSALDVGKAIAFHAGQTRPLWDFEDIGDWWTRADIDAIAPVIAVPTTAGTGSEAGRGAVITNEDSQRKVTIFHPRMLPAVVIADPELTVGLPRVLTVGTGLDALSHSLEAICTPLYHPLSQGIGMEGCRLVFENLPTAAASPTDLEARTRMLTAASMGAVAFQKGLGAMHAISHPCSVHFGTHHGMTNAVVMPYVLVANRPAIETTMARLAAYVGVGTTFDDLLDHVLAMRAELDVPHTLVELGVDPAGADTIVAGTVTDLCAATNPVTVDHDYAHDLFAAACEGRLD
ncbi:MAG: iron-containing alcohol dehydrogenase [Acidimicrobiales bacterium]|nr:iron-containing alcohol dehydrogenase [Acidimicrobiales bacterium]